MFFDQVRTPPDVLAVLKTSGLLAISEFHVFELAYVHWYGVETDEKTIERHFLPYMFQEQVPHYVRAFTRKVLRLDEAGRLDPASFGIVPDRRTARGFTVGLIYSACVIASVTVLVILCKVTAEALGVGESIFPPFL
jgi:hypothetical protein